MAKKRINREKDVENGTVKFTVIETGAELVCNLADLPKELMNTALIHAVNAKVGDAAADPKQDAMAAMTQVWKQLTEGDWSARSGGEGAGRVTILAEAVANVTGREVAEVVTMLGEKSDDEKKELRNHVQVSAEIASIQSKRAAVKAKEAGKAAKDAEPLAL